MLKGRTAFAALCLSLLLAICVGSSLVAQESAQSRFTVRHFKAKTLDLQDGDIVTVDGKKGRLLRVRITNGRAKFKAIKLKGTKPFIRDLSVNGIGQVAIAATDTVIIYDSQTGAVTTWEDADLFTVGIAWAGEGHVYFSDLGPTQDVGVADGDVYRFYPDTETIDSVGGRKWVNPAEIGVDTGSNIWVREFKGGANLDDALYAITPKGYARVPGAQLSAKVKTIYKKGGLQGADNDGLDMWNVLQAELGRVGLAAGSRGLLSVVTNPGLKKPDFFRSCDNTEIHSTASDRLNGDIYMLADGPSGKGLYMATFDPRQDNPDCDGLTKLTTSKRLKNAWEISISGADEVTAREGQ